MTINIYVSDLFFNLDFESCMEGDREGVDFNDARLLELAVWFVDCLDRLGVANLPLPGDLVTDFRRRL